MPTPAQDQQFDPNADYRRAFLLLRWLLIVVAGYLSLFQSIGNETAVGVGIIVVVVAFVLSNVAIALLPVDLLLASRSRHILTAIDAAFICSFLYNLRIDQAQIHLPLMAIVVLALIKADLRVVLLAFLVGVSLVGFLTSPDSLDSGNFLGRVDFLTMSLLFVVSIFYAFMLDRYDLERRTSTELLRERRYSRNVVDITGRLSAALQAPQIFDVLVERFGEMMPDVACSIVRLEAGREEAGVIASTEHDMPTTIPVETAPSLREAYISKETRATTLAPASEDGDHFTAMAVPLISRDRVVAELYFSPRGPENARQPMQIDRDFVEFAASTAANALAHSERFESMQELATTDSMTRLANHAAFQARLAQEVERARRHSRTVSLLMIDLDRLKQINDRHGHPVGDQVIVAVADAIRSNCREIDFGARYGGEEFVLILPETDLRSGVFVAERIRSSIERIHTLPSKVTVSIGVANCPLDAATTEELILAADKALYAAKDAGRNRVVPAEKDTIEA